MPPIDLPPETPQDALRFDLKRPGVVVIFNEGRGADISVTCTAAKEEGREKPHGGEPDVRVLRANLSSSSSSGDSVTLVHRPWRDSASTVIIEWISAEQETPTTHPALRWSLQLPGRSA